MIKKHINTQLYKVLSYNGVIVFGKLISSFVVSKVSAIFLGPSGFAIIGNFKNILQVFLGLSASGFETGVIKYIAESKNDENKLKEVITNVIAFSVILSLLIAPFIFLFSTELASYVLKDQSLSFVFKYLAIVFPLVSLSFLFIYILNGLQEFKLYTIVLTIANILNAALMFVFIYYFNLKGALLAALIIPSLNFTVGLVIKKIRELFFQSFKNLKNLSFKFFKSISVYLLMALYSTILTSLCYFLIRNSIINNIDIKTAGLWEAMNKISAFYMVFFTSIMTLYLLPKLSENHTKNGYNRIMKDYFKAIIPLTIVLFAVLFLIRLFLIKLFLTEDFIAIKNFFYLQLLGDFFKVIGFSLAMQFHAKKMVVSYFIADAILYCVFYLSSISLLGDFNLKGVFYAYLISTFLYLVFASVSIYVTRRKYLSLDE